MLKSYTVENIAGICPQFSIPLTKLKQTAYIRNIQDADKSIFGCPGRFDAALKDALKTKVKVFITWSGTDRNGKRLDSWASAVTNFRGSNLKSLFASIFPQELRADYQKDMESVIQKKSEKVK